MATTATFKQIRAGLVSNLQSLGIQSVGYMLESPTPPSIECYPNGVNYDQAFGRGMDMLTWNIRISVASSLDVPAQMLLDTYLAPSGSSSVKTLMDANKTLGGIVQEAIVTEATPYQVADTKDGGLAWSVTWTVEVRA